MGEIFSEDDGRVAAIAEMLRRERPMPTVDELERVDRRLIAARAPRRARRGRAGRGWRRVAAMACVSVGLLFTTAGSGLALSGYATPGSPVSAQYPDSGTTGHAAPGKSGAAPGKSGHTPTRPPAHRHAGQPSLGEIKSSGSSTHYVSLVNAETNSELPFTGFAAIPVLLAGIALIVTGAVVHRRTGRAS